MKANSYINIPAIGEDASLFTSAQLQQILCNEPRRLKGIDFLHLKDEIIFTLLGLQDRNVNITMLPYSIRRRVTTIREYVRTYSKRLLENELKKSNEELRTITMGDCNHLSSATSRDTYGCFGLNMLKHQMEGGSHQTKVMHLILLMVSNL